MDKIKLFCIPYAGGSSVVYRKWKNLLNENIELKPIELAGRGRRIAEPLYADLTHAVEDVFNSIKEYIINNDYAFFGHSMGALIVYRLLYRIQQEKMTLPVHVFFSGKGAPHVKPLEEKKYSTMSDSQFKKEVIKLGGTPPEIFDYPELSEVFLPCLRNDLKIAETVTYLEKPKAQSTHITVFFGKSESFTEEQRIGWKLYTSKNFGLHYFEGGHFFLNNETKSLLKVINGILAK